MKALLATLSTIIQKSDIMYIGVVQYPLGDGQIHVLNLGGFGVNISGTAAVGDYVLHNEKILLQSFGPVKYSISVI